MSKLYLFSLRLAIHFLLHILLKALSFFFHKLSRFSLTENAREYMKIKESGFSQYFFTSSVNLKSPTKKFSQD